MAGNLEGRVALVTGGGAGIGRAVALALIREGALVALADVNRKAGERALSMVKSAGGDGVFIEADVSDAAEAKKMVRTTANTYGRLDCAVNNAGIFRGINSPTHKCTEKTWDEVMRVNLKGVWLCMKYELPQMLKQGYGAIVNMSSIAGLVGLEEMSAYAASKHGIVGLTKSAALEYAGQNIRVNAVCPGSVNRPTVRGDKVWTTEKPDDGLHPMGRFCTSEAVAEAVVWLCSDTASFVTGHTLVVDGGRTAQ
ncbi:MAG: SDR family oxidoreductase [Candidatus Poribacteria bacterium]|nr:SDR family oxidoreductase [Candidatus Poribacteria bacterium]